MTFWTALSNLNKLKLPMVDCACTPQYIAQCTNDTSTFLIMPLLSSGVRLRACVKRLWYDNSGMQEQASASLS